jgi:hypothetical protein
VHVEPKDKALVENAVRQVYQRICFALKDQVFFDLHTLNATIRPLLDLYNQRMYQQRQTSRSRLFLEQEQPVLSPLPAHPFTLINYKQATVQKNYHVFISEDKHYYSVPHQYIGKRVELRYNETLLEVYSAGSRVASNPGARKVLASLLLAAICLKTMSSCKARIWITFYLRLSLLIQLFTDT